MDNNQFNNQYNNYGQQPTNNYGQPMNYTQPSPTPIYNQQPMYNQPIMGQPIYGQPKKTNTGLIVGIIIAVVVVVGVVISFVNSGKKIDGKWICTGSSGTLIINADASAKTVNMQLGTYKIDAKYRVSSTVSPTRKKDGYKYTQYVFTSGSNSRGMTYSSSNKVGFVFGIDSNDETKGHYLDSAKDSGVEFTCTKAS